MQKDRNLVMHFLSSFESLKHTVQSRILRNRISWVIGAMFTTHLGCRVQVREQHGSYFCNALALYVCIVCIVLVD